MTTKAKVIAKAKELGCTIDLNNLDIAIHAPKGLLLGGELHISVYDFECSSKKSIWQSLWYELNTVNTCEGSRFCSCTSEQVS
jgi:hypothetical protein